MRVLHVLSGSHFHGAEAMAAELIRRSVAAGLSTHLAVLGTPGGQGRQLAEMVGAPCESVAHVECRGQLDLAAVAELGRLVARHQIDVVHSHKYKATFYATLVRLARRVGLVTTYHNWLYDTRALRLYAAVDKRIARFNDLCIGVSGPVVAELKRFVPPERVLQIDNGIDLERFRPPRDRAEAKRHLGFDPDIPLVGFVGRLSNEKGVPCLLQAVSGLGAPVHVAIVGDGDLRTSIEAMVESLGLAHRVLLTGSRQDTPELYRAFDLFVLPSTIEAFPMVVLEAMASGCAIVATRVGEVSRMLPDDTCGVLVEPGDALALQTALEGLLAEPAGRQALGRAARMHVASNFSSLRMARAYGEAYHRAAKRTAPAQA